jgi:hypothetical protein
MNPIVPIEPIYPNPEVPFRFMRHVLPPCRQNTVACFAALQIDGSLNDLNKQGRSLPPCCLAHMSSMVKNMANFLNSHDFRYWLDYGSLLGLARNGKLLVYDHDTEIGIFKEDLNEFRSLAPLIQKAFGYDVTFPPRWPRITFSKVNHALMEVMVYEGCGGFNVDLMGGKYDRRVRQNPTCFLTPRCLFEDLKKIDYEGIPISVPSNIEDYLYLRYGPDWKKPVPNFYDGRVGKKYVNVYQYRAKWSREIRAKYFPMI